jgi:hypothetical protein
VAGVNNNPDAADESIQLKFKALIEH